METIIFFVCIFFALVFWFVVRNTFTGQLQGSVQKNNIYKIDDNILFRVLTVQYNANRKVAIAPFDEHLCTLFLCICMPFFDARECLYIYAVHQMQ